MHTICFNLERKTAEASPTYITGQQNRVGKTPIGLTTSIFFPCQIKLDCYKIMWPCFRPRAGVYLNVLRCGMRISHPIYCWASANQRADWNLLWEGIVTWCSLAYNILLSFNKCHLPLLALSHMKCQIKSEGHIMKISHSLQCKMFWPGQGGLNISAACQERCIEGKTIQKCTEKH